jgi:pSer/pThr/pTyr-binding forkhead associated (FHA) protein
MTQTQHPQSGGLTGWRLDHALALPNGALDIHRSVNSTALDLFVQACGGRAELLVESPGATAAEHRAFDTPFAIVGRDPYCDLSLDAEGMSRRHVYVQLLHGRTFYADLDSRTGVRWQDWPRPFGWLDADQTLHVESFGLRLPPDATPTESAEDVNPLESYPEDAEVAPTATLEFINGRTRHPRWRVHRMLTLAGKVPVCKIQLASNLVSRYHFSLIHTPEGIWVVDLLSREGTWVNGQRIRWARLDDGDRLQAGPFMTRVWYERPDGMRAPEDEEDGIHVSGSVSGPAHSPLGAPHSSALVPANPPPMANLPTLPSSPEQALLMPVISQFNLMQQQMFDQFHQTMLMMVQMFSTLHREQMDLIRDELDQLHGLTRELQELQAELVKHPPAKAPAPTAPAPQRSARVSDPAGRPTPQRAPTPSAQPEAKPAAPSAPQPAAGQDNADIHAWLSKRIAALQEERQGRWQKIVGYVLGK